MADQSQDPNSGSNNQSGQDQPENEAQYIQVEELKTCITGSTAYVEDKVGVVEENVTVNTLEIGEKVTEEAIHNVVINGKLCKVTNIRTGKVELQDPAYDYKFIRMLDPNMKLNVPSICTVPIKMISPRKEKTMSKSKQSQKPLSPKQ